MDQRDFTRIRHHLVATVTTADGVVLEGDTRDLSLGGVFVQTTQPVARGARCRLRFRAGDEHADIEFEGVVARVDPSGIGIRFLEIDVKGYDRLRRNLVD